jgi:hypothetical protein
MFIPLALSISHSHSHNKQLIKPQFSTFRTPTLINHYHTINSHTPTLNLIQNGCRSLMRKDSHRSVHVAIHSRIPRLKASCAQLAVASWPSLTRSDPSSMPSSVSSVFFSFIKLSINWFCRWNRRRLRHHHFMPHLRKEWTSSSSWWRGRSKSYCVDISQLDRLALFTYSESGANGGTRFHESEVH